MHSLVHALALQEVLIDLAVEGAELVAEARLADDDAAQVVVGDGEAGFGGELLAQRIADQRLEDEIGQAELHGLLEADRPARLLQLLELLVEAFSHLAGMDLDVGDFGRHGIARGVAENVAHAPESEGHDEDDEHDDRNHRFR